MRRKVPPMKFANPLWQRGRVLRLRRVLVFDPKVAVAGIDPSKLDHLHKAMRFKETQHDTYSVYPRIWHVPLSCRLGRSSAG